MPCLPPANEACEGKCLYTCHSVHRAGWGGGEGGVCIQGVCIPPSRISWDMVNERDVRILLERIFVKLYEKEFLYKFREVHKCSDFSYNTNGLCSNARLRLHVPPMSPFFVPFENRFSAVL